MSFKTLRPGALSILGAVPGICEAGPAVAHAVPRRRASVARIRGVASCRNGNISCIVVGRAGGAVGRPSGSSGTSALRGRPVRRDDAPKVHTMSTSPATDMVFFSSPAAARELLPRLLGTVEGVQSLASPRRTPAAARWYLDTRGGAAARDKTVLEATDDGDRLELVIRPRLSERVRWAIPLGTLPERIAEVPQPAVKSYLARLKKEKARLLRHEAPSLALTHYDLKGARDKLLGTVTLEQPADDAEAPALVRIRTRPGYASVGSGVAEALIEGGIQPLPATDPSDFWRAAPRHARRGPPKQSRRRAARNVEEILTTAAASLASWDELMAVHRQGVREDRDPEHLHQFRVSLRRSRSLLEALEPALARARVKRLRRGFRALNRVGGRRRDLDVLKGLIEARIGSGVSSEIRSELDARLARDRAGAHAELIAHLDSEEYRALAADWTDFVAGLATGSPEAVDPERRGALPPAGILVAEAYDRAVRLGRRAMASRVRSELHDTRKAIKRLRYLLDGLSPLLPAPAVQVVVDDTKSLQKAFGHFCDLELEQDFFLSCREVDSAEAPAGFDPIMKAQVEALGQAIHDQVQLCAWRFDDFDADRVRHQIAIVANTG